MVNGSEQDDAVVGQVKIRRPGSAGWPCHVFFLITTMVRRLVLPQADR